MIVEPDSAAFAARYAEGASQVVSTRLVADLETPVSAMLKLAEGQANSFLFESVEGGETRGRYSFIGLKPDIIWKSRGDVSEINRRARQDPAKFEKQDGPPLENLKALIEESLIDLPEDMPPMASGLFGYLGYDMVRHSERLPDTNPDTLGVPDAIMIRPTVIAIFDTVADIVTIVTPVRPSSEITPNLAFDQALERLADVVAQFRREPPYDRGSSTLRSDTAEPTSNTGSEAYCAAVEKAREYIRAGDIFQVVPSQRFSMPFPTSPFGFYRALRRLNPSPFLFFLDFGSFCVAGSSPEILVRVRNGEMTLRPLAGTRPRGKDRAEDLALEEDLLADEKERAEHLMLLDLGRNDVGRVAEIGSVNVTEQFVIERYSHVMHISSTVTGRLLPDKTCLDALMAGFPAGTVSGAPKVRSMEIIDELEVARRGVYAGAVGYFGANGDLDTCIALRTAVIKDRVLYIQAGAGIVADSDPETEDAETKHKAQALVRAAKVALGAVN
ncbi:MAG: anthranilate synthase component I [Pseudomonadota bacterium]